MLLFAACPNVTEESKGTGTDSDTSDTPASNYPSSSDKITIGDVEMSEVLYTNAVREISGTVPVSINLTGLNGHSVFLVNENLGSTTVYGDKTAAVLSYNSENAFSKADGVSASAQRNAAGDFDVSALADSLSGPVSGIFTGKDGQTIIRYEREGNDAELLNAVMAARRQSSSARGVFSLSESTGGVAAQSYALGGTKSFWVQKTMTGGYEQISAELKAIGTHSNVWVSTDNRTGKSISQAEAGTLAEKFDIIYEKETPIFGFEYGGGVLETDDTYGGADKDPRIQILVYDIFSDYRSDQTGGVMGYYYSGDEYTEKEVADAGKSESVKTNQAEIFYIDAHFTNKAPNAIYSTLAHEFQHMINFNQKTIISKVLASTWYNEMLSMLAEDLIDPFIGIEANTDGHPIYMRIPTFLAGDLLIPSKTWQNNVSYYAIAYAFGAYLVRNFGGVDLLKKMAAPDGRVDDDSINYALASSVNLLNSSVSSFSKAAQRYGEVFLFNLQNGRENGILSFNNTVTSNINGVDYTFEGFDIWTDIKAKDSKENLVTISPAVYDAGKSFTLKPNAVLIQSKAEWQNITGALSITVNPPASSNVKSYLVVR
jgi:hypothetical protein